jgi:phage host-nuclease inhibitor protein Gam
MARPKKSTIELKSLDECTKAMADLLVATTDIETLTAERDRAVAAASAEFEAYLDGAKEKQADLTLALRDYYYAHVGELEKSGARSVQLVNGVMGRRTSPPKLMLLNRNWTWGTVLVRLRERFGARFLRLSEPEIDKDLVKAELAVEELKALGLRLDQDEKFYAEPTRLPGPGEVQG